MEEPDQSPTEGAALRVFNILELVEFIVEKRALAAQEEGRGINRMSQSLDRRSKGLRQRRDALFQCLLVNKTWNTAGTRFLWEVHPKVQAFLDLPPTRRQHFANMVRVIDLGQTVPLKSRSIRALIPGVETFPNLATLNCTAGLSDLTLMQLCRSLFQHRLQHLRFKGPMLIGRRASMIDEIYSLLLDKCPELRSFELHYDLSRKGGLAEDQILNFFNKMPSLTSIGLASIHLKTAQSVALLKHIAERPNLRFLTLQDTSITSGGDALTERLATFLENPLSLSVLFRDLQSLKIRGACWNHCAALFPHLKQLRYLDIDCCLRSSNNSNLGSLQGVPYEQIVAELPESPNLRHLGLRVFISTSRKHYYKINGAGLLRLAQKYRKLHVLSLLLTCRNSTVITLDTDDIVDADFDVMTSLLPNLEVLKVSSQYLIRDLTTGFLLSLAKNCPQLEHCEVLGDIDITLLPMNRPCLFPRLRYLTMSIQIERCDVEYLYQVDSILQHHFPRLRSLKGFGGQKVAGPVVSLQAPWTADKLLRFLSCEPEEVTDGSDWSVVFGND